MEGEHFLPNILSLSSSGLCQLVLQKLEWKHPPCFAEGVMRGTTFFGLQSLQYVVCRVDSGLCGMYIVDTEHSNCYVNSLLYHLSIHTLKNTVSSLHTWIYYICHICLPLHILSSNTTHAMIPSDMHFRTHSGVVKSVNTFHGQTACPSQSTSESNPYAKSKNSTV